MFFYSIIHKPFQVLSQFSAENNKTTLKDFFKVPVDVYPVGRLDYDSEGLLILTNDKSLNHRLLHPTFKHQRTYWVQVDGAITSTAIQQLKEGVNINVDGKIHATGKCILQLFSTPPEVYDRNPPVRFRKSIPTSWISITLEEGKNRQVRKMTAAVGFPTLRLIRYSVEKCTLEGLAPGEMRILQQKEIHELLF